MFPLPISKSKLCKAPYKGQATNNNGGSFRIKCRGSSYSAVWKISLAQPFSNLLHSCQMGGLPRSSFPSSLYSFPNLKPSLRMLIEGRIHLYQNGGQRKHKTSKTEKRSHFLTWSRVKQWIAVVMSGFVLREYLKICPSPWLLYLHLYMYIYVHRYITKSLILVYLVCSINWLC